MSRLLDALDQAQQQRTGSNEDPASERPPDVQGTVPKPARIWTRLVWLMVLSALMVGAYALAQQQLDGGDPLQWLHQHLPGF